MPDSHTQTARFHRRGWILLLSLFLLGSCSLLPEPDPYPHRAPESIIAEAEDISARLDAYIRRWMAGEAPAEVPEELIPKGVRDNTKFRLARPEDVSPRELWHTRLARPLRRDAVQNGLPEPNVTYLFLKTPFAPLGHRLVVEGRFPHCRFFGFQITPPIDGIGYYPGRVFGSAEVPLSDLDIEPHSGHSNPFRPGAVRNSKRRNYRAVFDLAAGDPVRLNSMFKPPYRGRGNRRVGSLLVYQGPWGTKAPYGLDFGAGDWEAGALWGRIYAPDRRQGPLGGVSLPKTWFELSGGERYVLLSDSTRFERRANATMVARSTAPEEPKVTEGPTVGWGKSFGILLNILEGAGEANGWTSEEDFRRMREIDRGATGRGIDAPPPHNYEPHATTAVHNSYLGRSFSLGSGKIAVLTGKLPTFPDTRDGLRRMTRGQVRYWSIVGYDIDMFAELPGSAINALMDDEVVVGPDRFFTIVYSRKEDRPRNATERNGVTWVDWGPTSRLSLVMRWMTIRPEWSFRYSPDEINLPWRLVAKSSPEYDERMIGRNGWDGFMKEYLPQVTYMTREEFESLGKRVDARSVPHHVPER